MNRFTTRLLLGSALCALTLVSQAAPPKKEICPAPHNQAQQRAAVQAACRHFNGIPQSWGLHSAFNTAGQIISCLHFQCKPAPQGQPTPQDQGAAPLKRFVLGFNDAYLVHEPGSSSLQIAAQGNVLSYGNDWQVRKLKPYLYHFKQNNWQGFYWKVNTSRKEVYRVRGGRFGQMGGNEQRLNIGVDTVGNGMSPTRFFLRFRDAKLVQQAGSQRPQITTQGNVLSYGGDWQVRRLKPYLFHLKQNVWQGFHWKVNTSRKEVYRVNGGQFGQLGGSDQKINVQVNPVY